MQHPGQRPVSTPLLEVAVAGLIGRIALWKIRPLRPRAQNPQDAIEHFPRVAARSPWAVATPSRLRNQRADYPPLRVCEIQPRYLERGVVPYAGDSSSTGEPILAPPSPFGFLR